MCEVEITALTMTTFQDSGRKRTTLLVLGQNDLTFVYFIVDFNQNSILVVIVFSYCCIVLCFVIV